MISWAQEDDAGEEMMYAGPKYLHAGDRVVIMEFANEISEEASWMVRVFTWRWSAFLGRGSGGGFHIPVSGGLL